MGFPIVKRLFKVSIFFPPLQLLDDFFQEKGPFYAIEHKKTP